MFKINQKVRFVETSDKELVYTSKELHKESPQFYPAVGCIGKVVEPDGIANTTLVEWGVNSGVDDDPEGGHAWWVEYDRLEVIEDE